MSFEGTYQIICVNGHSREIDWADVAYADPVYKPEDWRCDCGQGMAWSNLIDETNVDPYPDNCEILLEVDVPGGFVTDPNTHETWWREVTYKIPTEQGARGGLMPLRELAAA